MLGSNCDTGEYINFSIFVKSRLIQYLSILLICLLLPLRVFSQYQSPIDHAASTSDANPTNVQENIPDIRSISRLNANTPAGTIAWATIDQLHPTQPQVGGREVRRKAAQLRKFMTTLTPQKFYEYLYLNRQVPIFVGPVNSEDSRAGKYASLAYPTDRHHAASAMNAVLMELINSNPALYRNSLTEPMLNQGFPTNVVIVRVVGNTLIDSNGAITFAEFAKFMAAPDANRAYLREWQPSTDKDGRAAKERPEITEIAFDKLPRTIWEMRDNPWRAAAGLIKVSLPGYYGTDFAQFKTAEYLTSNGYLKYSDIGPGASFQSYYSSVSKARRHLIDVNKTRLKNAEKELAGLVKNQPPQTSQDPLKTEVDSEKEPDRERINSLKAEIEMLRTLNGIGKMAANTQRKQLRLRASIEKGNSGKSSKSSKGPNGDRTSISISNGGCEASFIRTK